MGQAQVPYAVATNVTTPGIINVDGLTTTGGITASGAIVATSGITGSKAFLSAYTEPANTKAFSIGGRGEATVASAALVSGTVYAVLTPIETGLLISNVSLYAVGAESGGTHAWVGVADNTGKVLGISADNTGAAYFPATTLVTTALAAPFTTTYTGLYYTFVCVVAGTTVPTFAARTALANAAIANIAPVYCGTALTGQTTPVAVGSSLGTITGTAGHALYTYLT